MTQRAMADALGISLTQWRGLEKGRQAPKPLVANVLRLIADGLIKPQDLTDRRPYYVEPVFMSRARPSSGLPEAQ